MDKIKSDIEIARSAKIKPIKEILESIGVRDEKNAFSPIGHHIAKLDLEYIDQLIWLVQQILVSFVQATLRREGFPLHRFRILKFYFYPLLVGFN